MKRNDASERAAALAHQAVDVLQWAIHAPASPVDAAISHSPMLGATGGAQSRLRSLIFASFSPAFTSSVIGAARSPASSYSISPSASPRYGQNS